MPDTLNLTDLELPQENNDSVEGLLNLTDVFEFSEDELKEDEPFKLTEEELASLNKEEEEEEVTLSDDERLDKLNKELEEIDNKKTIVLRKDKLEEERANDFEKRISRVREIQEITNKPKLEELDSIIRNEEEESAVPKLRRLYSGFGIRFEETGLGDAVKVYTDEDKDGIVVDLDTFTYSGSKKETSKIKKYIFENKKDYKNVEVSDMVNAVGKPNTFVNLYDEKLIKEANEKVNYNLNNINTEINDLETKESEFKKEVDEYSKNINEGLITEDQAAERKKELLDKQRSLRVEREGLKIRYDRDVSKASDQIKLIQAEQTSILADRGTWVESWYNTALSVPDKINRFLTDGTNVLQDAVVDAKKYTGLINEDEAKAARLKNEIEKNIRNSISLEDEIGSDISNEYQQEFQATTFGAVTTSIVQMVTSSLLIPGGGAKAFGAIMGLQEAGSILEEMDDPVFEDVPDWQKVAFGSAVGWTVAKLEKLGASSIVGKNPLAKKLVLNVLKRNATKKLTQKTVQELLEKEIKSKLARGVFSVGVGGLMEGGTEVTQEIATVALKRGFNTAKKAFGDEEKTYFNAEQTAFDPDAMFQAFKVGAIAGGTFGTMNAFMQAKRQGVVNQLNEEQYKNARAFFSDENTIENKITQLRTELESGGKSQKEVDDQIRQVREIGSTFRELRKSTRLTADGEKQVFSLLQQKKRLQKQVDASDDKSLVSKQKEEILDINSQISEITTNEVYDFDKNFSRLEEEARSEAEKSGKEFNVLDSDTYKKTLSKLGVTNTEDLNSTGYINEDGNIYINKSAAEQLREIPVTSHELLHGILNKQLKGKTLEESESLIKDFKSRLNKKQIKAVNDRLLNNYNINSEDATSQEWFTALSDGVINNEVAFEETGFQELGRMITNTFLKPFGYKNASFVSGKQAFNFVKEYARQSKAISEGKQQTFEGQVGSIVSEGIDAGAQGAMSKSEATSLAKQYKEGSINPDKITDFIEQYHSLGLRAMKFDKSKGTIESEEAISFLNKEFQSVMRNYDPSKGLEFSTYVNSVIPKRAVAFYEEQIGDKSITTSTDSEQARQLEADDTPAEDTRTDKEIRQAERKGVKVREKIPKVYSIDNVVESVRAKAKNIKAKNIKQLKGFALREVVDMVARNDKALADSLFKKITKNTDLKSDEMLAIQKFINSNIDLAKGSLLEGYTSEFKSTGVNKKLLEKFYNKRSARAKTKPGLQVQIKKPNIKDSEIKEAFGITNSNPDNWVNKVVASEGGVSDILKGFVRNLDQVISSQEVREQLILDGKSEEALSTLKDGMPTGYFSKTAKSENLGKAFRDIKNEDNKAIFLGGLSEFIERINIGQDIEVSFIETYGDKFLTTGKNNENTKVKENLIKEFEKVVDNSPQKQFDKKSVNKEKLNEYLYKTFEEQTDPRVDVQESLGIDKDGVNFGDVKQIESFKNALIKIFKFNRSRFDNDLDFFKWALQHYETLAASAKIGSLPNHKWVKNLKGIWKLIEGKASGRSSSVRYGILNNKVELLNVLLKPFDNSNALTYEKGKGFFYDGVKIETDRAKQSKAATKFYLEEFLKTGKLSDKTLTDSYNDAIGNQEEIIRVLNFYKNNKGKKEGISKNDLGMYFMSSTGDMTSILRSAYPIDSISLSDSTNPSDYRFEHNPPVRVMKIYMAQYINGQINESQLREKFADASVSVIPEQMDDVINIRYKDTIPLAYINRFSRYFNNFSIGKFPFEMTVYTPTIKNGKPISWKKSIKGKNLKNLYENVQKAKEVNKTQIKPAYGNFSKSSTNEDIIGYAKTVDEALAIARDPSAPVKKIRVFDFDDTLATTKSDVLFTTPDGIKGKLNAEEFAKDGARLLEEGYVFDFSEFNKVTGGKPGPLLDIAKKIQEARGTEDVFVLTARAPEAQVAIKEFLDSVGLNIPLENITGLGNSTGAAKAKWIIDKAAKGYNDFYFADDAYQNVEAVQDALSQLDVKSKVQQAKVKFSKTVNEDFNKIIEQTTGIASEKTYSKAKAKVRGAGKGNKKFFIPYSAEDFMGLIYPLLSKGKLGDSQMAWFKQNLLDPYARAVENLSTDRLQLMEDFKALKKALEVPKNLRKQNDTGFTNEQAVRVYLFNKMGYDTPGLSKTDLQDLIDVVNSDGLLKAFADQLMNLTKGDGYAKPGQSWLAGTITTDLIDVLNTVKRKKYLEQSGFLENADLIFSEENLNKLEAAYGEKYRESMENILKRMKSGKNRLFSGNRLSNRVLDYVNGSIGTIMFLNARSAVLQTISSINFINWSFNNPIKAGKAFANQKQYWKDFMDLMNSDYLMDRRNGLKLNISESEIADAASTSKNKAKAAINYILQKGFAPTQIADSFAIASGGATFYRNRINDLIKNEGLTEAEAKEKAMLEFRQIAETSQQSSDPSKISAQQSSDLGRVVLAFANTPMQYARLQKRAAQDLINGRGDAKSHVSKIIYYGVVQNIIFNALQQSLFALGFGDDEDEMTAKELEAHEKDKNKRYYKIANGMLDSQLRGLGVAGATAGVIKNFLLDIYERADRKRPEYVDAVYKLLQISPPISSKISKVRQAAYQFDSKKRREEIFEKGFSLDNPAYEAGAKVLSATTNIPLDRVYNKVNNIEAALAEDTETWQTVAMLAGWPEWQIKPDKDKKQNKTNNKSDFGFGKVNKTKSGKDKIKFGF